MNDILEPLTLATGSNAAGSGMGCAMNVISWENGDQTITDTPACSDKILALLVQRLNDCIGERVGEEVEVRSEGRFTTRFIIPAEWSTRILEVAHRTVGTASNDYKRSASAWYQIFNQTAYGYEFAHSIPEYMFVTWAKEGYWELVHAIYPSRDMGNEAMLEYTSSIIEQYRTLMGITDTPVLPVPLDEAVCKMREKVNA